MTQDARAIAETLNHACHCRGADVDALTAGLSLAAASAAGADDLLRARPHLISGVTAFVAEPDMAAMLSVVAAVEAAASMPRYQEQALARAGANAAIDHGPAGVFMGYDFHLTADGPRLIEVNTNAGGAFISAAIARTRQACLPDGAGGDFRRGRAEDFDAAVIASFRSEWRRQRGAQDLRRVAIVDDAPSAQFLYPEFLLARRLFETNGVEATIVDAADLDYSEGRLLAGGRAVDLVYNRVTDFSLTSPSHAALAAAYETGGAVVTPSPRHHALFADKRNLVRLSDRDFVRGLGLDPIQAGALAFIPPAVEVGAANAVGLWASRQKFYFKPVGGFGSKAVYRGDKITRTVWSHIVAGGYIAQEFARPAGRTVKVGGVSEDRKFDIRLYTYDGALLLAAARLYQGQTTNFRTPGGGFAPVFVV